MVYGLIIHSLEGTVWFSHFFTPEGNDSFKKQRVQDVVSDVCREHQFRVACTGKGASRAASVKRRGPGQGYDAGRVTMMMSGRPVHATKPSNCEELVTTSTSAKILCAAQIDGGAEDFFANDSGMEDNLTSAHTQRGNLNGSYSKRSYKSDGEPSTRTFDSSMSFLCRPTEPSSAPAHSISSSEKPTVRKGGLGGASDGVSGFFSVLSPSKDIKKLRQTVKRYGGSLSERKSQLHSDSAPQGANAKADQVFHPDATPHLSRSDGVALHATSSPKMNAEATETDAIEGIAEKTAEKTPSLASAAAAAAAATKSGIASGEGAFRITRSDILSSSKTVIWRHVLNSVFVLICEPQVDNTLLASNFLAVYVSLLCKEFHDPFVAASPSQFLSSPDTMLTLTNKLLPCGQLLFMHPSMAEYIASAAFLREDVEDYFEGNDPALAKEAIPSPSRQRRSMKNEQKGANTSMNG